jgi:hypothetical protein
MSQIRWYRSSLVSKPSAVLLLNQLDLLFGFGHYLLLLRRAPPCR